MGLFDKEFLLPDLDLSEGPGDCYRSFDEKHESQSDLLCVIP